MIIKYKFYDGHTEELEVSDEVKHTLEQLDAQEKNYKAKVKKQKQRAGLSTKADVSLEQLCEVGQEPLVDANPPNRMLQEEQAQELSQKIMGLLTDKQREVYILHHIKGIRKVKIAKMLNVSEKAVRKRLIAAYNKIFKNFLK